MLGTCGRKYFQHETKHFQLSLTFQLQILFGPVDTCSPQYRLSLKLKTVPQRLSSTSDTLRVALKVGISRPSSQQTSQSSYLISTTYSIPSSSIFFCPLKGGCRHAARSSIGPFLLWSNGDMVNCWPRSHER